MVWPKLVGNVVIRERAPRYQNEPRYKRLDFIRERNPPDLNEWDLVHTSEPQHVVIVQETNQALQSNEPLYPDLPPAPPLSIQQSEYYDPWYYQRQQYQQHQHHHQPQQHYQHHSPQQQNVPPPPPPYPGIRHQPQITYHDAHQRRIEFPDRQSDIIQIINPDSDPDSNDYEAAMAYRHSDPRYVEVEPRSRLPSRTRLISSKKRKSKSITRRLIPGESVYASDSDSHHGGHHYYRRLKYGSDDSLNELMARR